MVRLGAKSTQRTKCMTMSEQSGGRKLNASTWNIIDQRKSEAASLETDLKKLVEAYRTASIEKQDILDHVEFSEHD